MDTFSKEMRSKIMSTVHSRNTRPEIILRKALFAKGLRYRLHCKLPGSPDLVFPSRHTVVMVHGCFWHCCPWHGRIPASNKRYWKKKLERNKERDRENAIKLKRLGWNMITVWEHQIMRSDKLKDTVGEIQSSLAEKVLVAQRASPMFIKP